MNSPEDATQVLGRFLFMLLPFVTVHGVACFLECLGGNPSFFRDLTKGETAATEVKRRWNAEGARNAPIAKSLEKPGLETWEWKEACYPVNSHFLSEDETISISIPNGQISFRYTSVNFIQKWKGTNENVTIFRSRGRSR
jgi:hypothetical protein